MLRASETNFGCAGRSWLWPHQGEPDADWTQHHEVTAGGPVAVAFDEYRLEALLPEGAGVAIARAHPGSIVAICRRPSPS